MLRCSDFSQRQLRKSLQADVFHAVTQLKDLLSDRVYSLKHLLSIELTNEIF